MIVRMNARVLASRVTEKFCGTVRQNLVGVHVVRCPRPGLVDVDHELIAQLAVQDVVGGPDDRARDLRRQAP